MVSLGSLPRFLLVASEDKNSDGRQLRLGEGEAFDADSVEDDMDMMPRVDADESGVESRNVHQGCSSVFEPQACSEAYLND